MRLNFLLASLAFAACLLAFSPSLTSAQVCTAAPPLPSVVKVLLLMRCNSTQNLFLDTNPMFSTMCKPDSSLSGPGRTWHYGIDFYVSSMQAQQPMPLRDGTNVSFAFTYLSLGLVTSIGTEQAGFMYDLLTTTTYGGPYAYVVLPFGVSTGDLTTITNICEDNSACMVGASFSATSSLFICSPPLPADCTRHKRPQGARRFNNLLGVLFDSTTVAYSGLDTFHTLGSKTVAIIAEGPYFSLFPGDAVLRTQEFAKQLNMKVVNTHIMELCNTTIGNCPTTKWDGTAATGQSQIFANGNTAVSIGQMLKDLNPDVVICIGSTTGQSGLTFASLYDGFRAVDWTPKMISWAGGADGVLKPFMRNYNDLLYTWTTAPWDYRLTGPAYRNVKTPVNFELYPAETDMDAPQVFAREFNKKYNNTYPINFATASAVFTTFGFQALTFFQKLIENALSQSVQALVTASLRVSVPSLYHQLQFDTVGRTSRLNEMLLQYRPGTDAAHSLTLIAPYNIGETPIYPIPTWAEREFHPQMYALGLEKMMAGVTAVCIFACLVLCILLIKNRTHSAVRAATPSFCVMTIMGAILMLTSNFFNTTVASDAHCAAQAWLLSLGFSLLFCSLFIKTFRIWKIFFSTKKLVLVKMKDGEMLAAVAGFLLVDIIINAIWMGTEGMKSKTVIVDSLRPSMNYITCDYSSNIGFVYAHMVIKCGLLLMGIALTWMVRNTPSLFNESTFIGISIYNVSIVICFVVPILSADLGGRDAQYLIRAFGIMFVTVTTVMILYIPKLIAIIHNTNGRAAFGPNNTNLDENDENTGSTLGTEKQKQNRSAGDNTNNNSIQKQKHSLQQPSSAVPTVRTNTMFPPTNTKEQQLAPPSHSGNGNEGTEMSQRGTRPLLPNNDASLRVSDDTRERGVSDATAMKYATVSEGAEDSVPGTILESP